MNYNFLPFRFRKIENSFLLVNDIGEYIFLDSDTFDDLINKKILKDTEIYYDLLSKNIIYNEHLCEQIKFLAEAYKTKKSYLYDFTSLHIFILTHRCNQNCTYCQASSEPHTASNIYDMDFETAESCVDIALKSPSKNIKIEFQGGEPLLNFDTLKRIVGYTKFKNESLQKNIEFVVCTNLTKLTQDILEFIKINNIYISTSLDGPKEVHNRCRLFRDGSGTFDQFKENLITAQNYLGVGYISALLTVSKSNIDHLKSIVDEYIKLNLPSIFIRMLNPHGLAIENWNDVGYSIEEFVYRYIEALDYIIDLNRNGIFFPEEFASIALKKILTPFSSGYVDLRSPAGAGIGVVVYEVNGDLYISDEARMLAKKTNDKTFRIGNAKKDLYEKMFFGKKIVNIINESIIEATPGCAWCSYLPYCGSDPVRNYIEFKNFGRNSSAGDFCNKHKRLFDMFFAKYIFNLEKYEEVLWKWL